jgi:mannose-1-phosphate guanylyltransferase/mannose-6-phosphate isomerase
LSGGSGTRLWPLSREKYPKQLLPLIGDDSLLQATVRRTDGIAGLTLAAPMVVCNEEYRFVIAEQLRLMGTRHHGAGAHRPQYRAGADAGGAGSSATAADPVLLVMPADHVITDTAAFRTVVRQGAELAANGVVVTFGITPDARRPVTATSRPARPGPADAAARRLPALSRSPIWPPRSPTWRRAPTCGTAASS